MTHSEIVLVFTETARGWGRHKPNEQENLLIQRLNQSGFTVFHNNYTLAFHNLHHPIVLISGAKFLREWSLPNPILAVPQISMTGELDFLRHDSRVRTIFLPATQLDLLSDERVRIGSITQPALSNRIIDALNLTPHPFHPALITS